MAALGFTAAAQHWAQLFLTDTLGTARVNGAPSCTLCVINECPQGNPIFPLLYILQSQPLLAHIRHLQNTSVVRPISLPTGISAPLCHQHADDTNIHAATIADCDTIVSQSLGLFSAASGAQLNATKTQTLCFGTSRPNSPQTSNITGIVYDPTTTHAKHLGIIVGRGATADAARSSRANALLHSVRTTIRHWSNHRLPYFARCEVAKQCLQSKVVHLCSFVTLPKNAIITLKTLIYGYIGKNRIVLDATQSALHPSRLVSALPRCRGGAAAPCLQHFLTALMAKQAFRQLEPQPLLWKSLRTHILATSTLRKWGTGLAVYTPTMATNTLDDIPPTYRATIAAAHAVGTHPLPTDIPTTMIARLFWSAEAVADPP